MSGLGTLPAPKDLHAHPDRSDCPHPFRSLRYDGIQDTLRGKMASVTCTEADCLNTMLVPIREDELERLNGGSRADQGHGGPVGSVVVMGQNDAERPLSRSTNSDRDS